MGWETIAQLIITLGVDATQRIIANWENKQAVTAAEFAQVIAMAAQDAKARLTARATALGLDLTDPNIQKIIALAG